MRARDVDRLAHALQQVVVEGGVGHARGRVFPADDEHGEALVQQVAHQALLLVEIEDVELVDPGRDDDQRHRVHSAVVGA